MYMCVFSEVHDDDDACLVKKMHAILCYVLFEDKRMIVLQMMCNMWILFYLMSLNCQGKGSTKAIIVFRNLTPSSSQPDSNN